MSEPIPHNQQAFADVLKQIQHARQNVFAHINTALIDLYWHIANWLLISLFPRCSLMTSPKAFHVTSPSSKLNNWSR
jgi:hypothetical protein